MNAIHRPGTDENPDPIAFSAILRGGGGGTFPPSGSTSHTPRDNTRSGAIPRSSNNNTPRPMIQDESVIESPASLTTAAISQSGIKGRVKAAIAPTNVGAVRSKSATRSRSATRYREESTPAKSRGVAAMPSPMGVNTHTPSASHQRGFSFAGPNYKASLATPNTHPAAALFTPHSPTAAGNFASSASSTTAAAISSTAPVNAEGLVDRKSFLKLQRSVDSLTRQLQLLQRQGTSVHPASPASSLKKAQRSVS
jgi:hypothetical protein